MKSVYVTTAAIVLAAAGCSAVDVGESRIVAASPQQDHLIAQTERAWEQFTPAEHARICEVYSAMSTTETWQALYAEAGETDPTATPAEKAATATRLADLFERKCG